MMMSEIISLSNKLCVKSTHSAHAFLRGQKNLVQNILQSSLGVYKVIFTVFAISLTFLIVL